MTDPAAALTLVRLYLKAAGCRCNVEVTLDGDHDVHCRHDDDCPLINADPAVLIGPIE